MLPSYPGRSDDALPNALEQRDALMQRLLGGAPASSASRVVLFLDYDGTLAAIVDDPAKATIGAETREVLRRSAATFTTGIVSGRSNEKLARFLAGVDGLYLAGSHGLDIVGPGGETMRHEVALRARPVLEEASRQLEAAVGSVRGYLTEDNLMCISAHYRMVAADDRELVHEAARRAVAQSGGALQHREGKMVHELRPAVEWDKGRAAEWLLGEFASAGERRGGQQRLESDGGGDGTSGSRLCPLFVGDDVADEDGFRFVERVGGVGIKVGPRSLASAATAASYQLDDPEQVRAFLEAMVSAAVPA